MMGMWMVHIIDHKLYREVAGNPSDYPKDLPSDDNMIFRFVGRANVGAANGEQWKKQSPILRQAFSIAPPIGLFVSLARNVFQVLEASATSHNSHTRTVRWSDLGQRYALDAVGSSILGANYDAIRTESLFVSNYNAFMRDVAQPVYLMFPTLERILPRKAVSMRMDNLVKILVERLETKRSEPGEDLMTSLVNHPDMSPTELRDNMAALFIAGHDTTSGAIASVVYFLAVYTEGQKLARDEVIRVLGPTLDPSLSVLNPQSLPYLCACIRETLRINSPTSYLVPRNSGDGVNLGRYYIPPKTLMICNIYAAHHNGDVWGDPHVFRPERFLEGPQRTKGALDRDPFLTFSTGPRQCPAQNFATYELRTLLAMLLREYDWWLPDSSIHAKGLQNAFSPFGLTLPRDLDITFRKRLNSDIATH
ncbi:cytochrome P450 [Leucogyrophana mollusca]|uniref:Cytochrome P450 n=1 Tax=Leucogyrophana mollusca TaxID=85980 RepID=A0ACB8B2I5_9AGAM|nr:cytochrome P450 [Leucogyrophana mollusca]